MSIRATKILSTFITMFMLFLVLPQATAAAGEFKLTFDSAPTEITSLVVQNTADGTACIPDTSGGKIYSVNAGTYAYTIKAAGYTTKMGVVKVAGDTTETVTLTESPRVLNMDSFGTGDDHLNGTGGNAGIKDISYNPSNVWFGDTKNVSWIKYEKLNILGGIEAFSLRYSRASGSQPCEIDICVAPPGSTYEESVPIGTLSFNTVVTDNWGKDKSVFIEQTNIEEHTGGIRDVYFALRRAEINFGELILKFKEETSTGVENQDISFSVKPYDATFKLETLSGQLVDPNEVGGKTYTLPEETFYKYTVSKQGYKTVTEILPVTISERITTVLLPDSTNEYDRFEAEDGSFLKASVVTKSAFSGGQGVGNFNTEKDTTVTPNILPSLGISGVNSTFTNIPHLKFEMERETTGIVEVIIAYESSVINNNQDRVIIKSNDGTVKVVPLNTSGKSSIFLGMRAGSNTISISSTMMPRVSNNMNAWVNFDYIDVNKATVPGSIEPDEADAPYIPPNNPFIRGIFTADPEAHVWPTNPNKLYVYPSRDNFPAQGCGYMDAPHVFSTENMVDWVDEGEIVRATDLAWVEKPEIPFVWAPDAAYFNGYYYYYFPIPRNSDNWDYTWETGVLRSRYPDRGFEQIPASETYTENFQGYIKGPGDKGIRGLIDPCVRVFDGKPYLYIGGGQRYFQAELMDDMVTIKEGTWQAVTENNATDTASPVYNNLPYYHEGPSVFKRGDLYYLIYPGGYDRETGFEGDKFNYCISENPAGPWEYKGKFFNPTGNDTSHGSIVEFRDKWYFIYHTADMSGQGNLRSICADEVIFEDDGSIRLFSKTVEGVSQNGPDYVRPEGNKYGADNAVVDGGAIKSADSSAGHDGKIITDLYIPGASVTFGNVDGGAGGRAMIVFHYSTPDALPKLELSVNDDDPDYSKNYKRINFLKTGGRSFFTETTFTVQKLKPGATNTITLKCPESGGGKVTINYIEVIPFDDSAPRPGLHNIVVSGGLSDKIEATIGEDVTLTHGQSMGAFLGWKVISPNGLVIENNKFSMPNEDVELQALFEKLPQATIENINIDNATITGTINNDTDTDMSGKLLARIYVDGVVMSTVESEQLDVVSSSSASFQIDVGAYTENHLIRLVYVDETENQFSSNYTIVRNINKSPGDDDYEILSYISDDQQLKTINIMAKGEFDSIMLVATYDQDGRMLEIKLFDIDNGEQVNNLKSYDINLNLVDTETVKAFVWNKNICEPLRDVFLIY